MNYSYKDLCKEFGEEPAKGGNNRSRQLARFNKTHEVVKVGRNKYEIVRENTLEEIQLSSDKEHYSKYLQTILLNMIADCPTITMVFTYRQMRENLMMVNEHYFPAKYKKEELNIKSPSDYDNSLLYGFERQWIGLADDHDTTTIKYNLKALKKKHLITDLSETYVFYKFEKDANGNVIYHQPCVATLEQRSELHQRELDYIHEKIPLRRMKEIKDSFASEEECQEKFYGACLHELFKGKQEAIDDFYKIVKDYTKELGFTRYAKAFVITRPSDLKRVANYFAPEFNKHQVQRYLTTAKFKTIPPFIHEQMTKQLIER